MTSTQNRCVVTVITPDQVMLALVVLLLLAVAIALYAFAVKGRR